MLKFKTLDDKKTDIIANLNSILNSTGATFKIHGFKELNEELWLFVFKLLFKDESLRIHFSLNDNSSLQDFLFFLNNSPHCDKPIQLKLLLGSDVETIDILVHTLKEINKVIIWYFRKPNDKLRQKFSLKELLKFMEHININSSSIASFSEIKPELWGQLLINLFNVPEKERLMDLIRNEPVKGIQVLLLTLSKNVIRTSLDFIDPILVCRGDDVFCCLLAEIFVALGHEVILQPFSNVRHLSYTTTASASAFILEQLNLSHSKSKSLSDKNSSTKSVFSGKHLIEPSNNISHFRPAELQNKHSKVNIDSSFSAFNIAPEDNKVIQQLKERKKTEHALYHRNY